MFIVKSSNTLETIHNLSKGQENRLKTNQTKLHLDPIDRIAHFVNQIIS